MKLSYVTARISDIEYGLSHITVVSLSERHVTVIVCSNMSQALDGAGCRLTVG